MVPIRSGYSTRSIPIPPQIAYSRESNFSPNHLHTAHCYTILIEKRVIMPISQEAAAALVVKIKAEIKTAPPTPLIYTSKVDEIQSDLTDILEFIDAQ